MKVTPTGYRPDLDGLRAIAVLSVVAFHIDESVLPGGFIGVDIFFVISGYLITSILQRQMVAGRFSFVDFYKRRILRIAPAYFVVTLVTLVVGQRLLLPDDVEALARSALWSAFSVPNIYFWQHLDTGYFASASNQVPLLHLWSLGVEEQFYLLWPVTLLLLGRWLGWRRALAAAVAGVSVASFVLAEHTASSAPSFAYYMLPARAGELLSGGLLALVTQGSSGAHDGKSRAIRAEVFALTGYAFLAYGLYGLDGESLFPGINALYPCIGTVLLIYAGSLCPARAMAPLRWRPVVWIGLISYSLYLWHWPILAYTRYFTTTISPITGMGCLAAMFTLAWLSYRWVELPFRQNRPTTLIRRHAPMAYLISSAALAMMATLMLTGNETVELVPKTAEPSYASRLQAMKERMQAALKYDYNCQRARVEPDLIRSEKCVIRPADSPLRAPVDAILVGDSNAAHYIGVVAAIGEAEQFAFRNLSLSSCPPLFGGGDRFGNPTDRGECTRYRETIRREVKNYKFVLLGAQWSFHSRAEGFEASLERTLQELGRNGSTVVILGQVPRFSSFNQKCELRRVRTPELDCRKTQGIGKIPTINKRLMSLAQKYSNVYYMDISSTICHSGDCSPYIDGQPVYYNAGHLSMTGSWDIGHAMVNDGAPLHEVFRKLGQSRSRAGS